MSEPGTDEHAAAAAVETTAASGRRGGAEPGRAGRRSTGGSRCAALDQHQVVAYDLAHAASAVAGCRVMLDYARARRARGGARVHVHRRRDRRRRPRGSIGRDEAWGVEPERARTGAAVRRRSTATPRSSSRSPTRCRSTAPAPRTSPTSSTSSATRFHRFAADKIRPGRRAHPPRERRHPRGHHRGHGRARRLRPLGARGVRRVRGRRRVRLPRDVRRDRGALVGLARRGRRAHHPARDPHPGDREGRHRGAEARVAPADRDRASASSA